MIDPAKRIADIVRTHMERIRDDHGRPMNHQAVATMLKLSRSQIASARRGGSVVAAMEIMRAGGASSAEIAEVSYLAGLRAFPQVTP